MKTADSEACGLLPISAKTLIFFFFFQAAAAATSATTTKSNSLSLFLGLRAQTESKIKLNPQTFWQPQTPESVHVLSTQGGNLIYSLTHNMSAGGRAGPATNLLQPS